MHVAVVQDGWRLHYAVPLALHRAGALEVMYSEWFLKRGITSDLLRNTVGRFGPAFVRGLIERRCDEIPPRLVRTNFPLVLKQRLVWRKFSSGEAFWRWSSNATADWIIRRGFAGANAVFGFIRNIDPRVLAAARQAGIATVADQIIAPAAEERAQAARQAEKYPDWETSRAAPDFSIAQEIESATWPLLDRITCGSDYVRNSLIAQGIAPEKIATNPYPIDASQYPSINRRGRSGPLTIGFVGAVCLRKGAPVFFQIARRLAGPNLRFVMVGLEQLRPLILDEHRKFIEFTGAVPRSAIGQRLAQFDIFLFPSTCEGSSVAVLEAMASGLPIVTTPNSGSVVRASLDGFIRACDDLESLTACVEKLAADQSLRLQMGEQARQQAAATNLESFGQRLLDVLQTAANSPK